MEGRAVDSGGTEAGPRYFQTLRVPVAEGREFTIADTAGALPVAIVSRTLARRLSPEGSALGISVTTQTGRRTVIGVVNDTMLPSRGEEMTP